MRLIVVAGGLVHRFSSVTTPVAELASCGVGSTNTSAIQAKNKQLATEKLHKWCLKIFITKPTIYQLAIVRNACPHKLSNL